MALLDPETTDPTFQMSCPLVSFSFSMNDSAFAGPMANNKPPDVSADLPATSLNISFNSESDWTVPEMHGKVSIIKSTSSF